MTPTQSRSRRTNKANRSGRPSPTVQKLSDTLTVTHRHDKSKRMKFIHAVIRPFRPRIATSKSSNPVDGSPRLHPPKRVSRKCHVRERQVDGIWLYDLTPRQHTLSKEQVRRQSERQQCDEEKREKKRIVYFAGGGWQLPATGDHWSVLSEIVCQMAPTTSISLVSYPLAPLCPAGVTMAQLKALYDTLMEEAETKGEETFFMGDSAGGNIALCLVTWALMKESARSPKAIIAICPSTDLRHVDPGMDEVAPLDPLLTVPFVKSTANAWARKTRDSKEDAGGGHDEGHDGNDDDKTADAAIAEWSTEDPRVSPILARLDTLVKNNVKVHGIMGTWDILSVEARAFRERCAKEGVHGEWLEWDGQMHCFPMAFRYGLKESREALQWVVDLLKKA